MLCAMETTANAGKLPAILRDQTKNISFLFIDLENIIVTNLPSIFKEGVSNVSLLLGVDLHTGVDVIRPFPNGMLGLFKN